MVNKHCFVTMSDNFLRFSGLRIKNEQICQVSNNIISAYNHIFYPTAAKPKKKIFKLYTNERKEIR